MTNPQALSRASASQPGATAAGATRERAANDTTRSRDETTLLPAVDVVEDATGITLYADLPGVPKDKLDVRVEAESLTINGELGLALPEGMTASHAEVQVTRYRRTFTLSRELDADQVDAEFVNGVLKLRVPKARDAQPRRIEVRAR